MQYITHDVPDYLNVAMPVTYAKPLREVFSTENNDVAEDMPSL